MRDAVQAIVDKLKAEAAIISRFGADTPRIYAEELPQSEAAAMARDAMVVRRVPGPAGYATATLERGAVDIACFGATRIEAETMREIVRTALKDLGRFVQSNTLLHWTKPSGAPAALRESDTRWPVVVETWEFLASETATT